MQRLYEIAVLSSIMLKGQQIQNGYRGDGTWSFMSAIFKEEIYDKRTVLQSPEPALISKLKNSRMLHWHNKQPSKFKSCHLNVFLSLFFPTLSKIIYLSYLMNNLSFFSVKHWVHRQVHNEYSLQKPKKKG